MLTKRFISYSDNNVLHSAKKQEQNKQKNDWILYFTKIRLKWHCTRCFLLITFKLMTILPFVFFFIILSVGTWSNSFLMAGSLGGFMCLAQREILLWAILRRQSEVRAALAPQSAATAGYRCCCLSHPSALLITNASQSTAQQPARLQYPGRPLLQQTKCE